MNDPKEKVLKAFYFVVTNKQTWGRGLTLKEALTAAKSRGTKYVIIIGVCSEAAREDQIKNIMNCYNVNEFGGLNFYTAPTEPEKLETYKTDTAMNDFYLTGWIVDKGNAQ